MNKVEEYTQFFQDIDENTPLYRYRDFFDENSYFEDPFQNVTGVEGIYHIFEDMYKSFYNPRFEVHEHVSNEDISYIRWTFLYQMNEKAKVNSFIGVSRVIFNDDGKVAAHVDFWDAGVNVYEKIPVLGSIIRFIKRKIHA